MSTFKVVLEIETSYSEDELAEVLNRIHSLPRDHDPHCQQFEVRVLAMAETRSSRKP